MTSLAYCIAVLFAISKAEGAIGMNWGRQSVQRLVPSMVVDLLLQNGIKEARIYSSQKDILRAFAGSGISLTVSLFNVNQLTNSDQIQNWVQDKLVYFSSANIRHVYVGSNEFGKGLTNKPSLEAALGTLETLQMVINEAGAEQIKVTMPHPINILKNMTKPSEAEFCDEIKEEMSRLLRFLQDNNSPFVIELFPIEYVRELQIDPNFAFPDNKSTHIVQDINGMLYTNLFEYAYDSFVWALKKVGAPDMEIIVGQIGWPTDGYPGANIANAERFYKSLLPMVVSNKGTPMRPGKPIDIYVHSLTDETKNPPSLPFARHWGIYRSNGEPKYKIDLTGLGREIFPSRAKGIMRMPQRWCVFNGDKNANRAELRRQFNTSCEKADCTSLAPGGSCSHLDYFQNMSYAFNMYFQAEFQNETACNSNGFGRVVTENPSVGECVFPVEVVRGQQQGLYGKEISGGVRVHPHEIMPPGTFFVVVIISALWGLIWDYY